MLMVNDYVRVTRDVVDGCTRIEDDEVGTVVDAPDASGVATVRIGGQHYRLPSDALEEWVRPVARPCACGYCS